VLPLPIVLVALIEPPCCSHTVFTMARPSPKPDLAEVLAALVRKNRMNIFERSASEIPIPVSRTDITTARLFV
jgi:hypothetical protein